MSCVLVLQYYVSVAAFSGDKRTHSFSVATVLDIIYIIYPVVMATAAKYITYTS